MHAINFQDMWKWKSARPTTSRKAGYATEKCKLKFKKVNKWALISYIPLRVRSDCWWCFEITNIVRLSTSHSILLSFYRAKTFFASTEFQKSWSSSVIEDYIWALKLFHVICCNGWQGWTWIETWKSWVMFLGFRPMTAKNYHTIWWLVFPDEISLISSS